VEGAPQFLERLAEARPFGSEEAFLPVAFDVAHAMPEGAQVELVDSHPRIGADAATVSAMSYQEQGYALEDGDEPEATEGEYQDESLFSAKQLAEAAAAERARETAHAYEELAMLNELYEQRFGFRYVVFVAGRPKTEIVPLLEHALRNEREVELRRAIDDAIYIAGDRLRRLRGLGTEV
jgi:2-oxo-4-hydroxy-4-carboxy--5-ureidoimidazoline (OHCU) decarboxylase